MLFGIVEFDIYAWVNNISVVAGLLCAAALIFVAWMRHRRAGTATTWPSIDPVKYFKKDERRKFNPLSYALCFGLAYLALVQALPLTGLLFNITVIRGQLTMIPGTASFAGGVLVFIPVFLLLSLLFPGNGKPTRQLELMMPALGLQYVFVRLACYLGGCCFGTPFRFGVVYPEGSPAAQTYELGARLFPGQLVESIVVLLCVAAIVVLYLRGKRTLPIFPLVFGATGFLVGFVSSPYRQPLQPLFGFTYPTPFAHLLVFLVGVVFLLLVVRERKRAC